MPIWYYADSTISWRSWRLSGTLRVRQFLYAGEPVHRTGSPLRVYDKLSLWAIFA
ncbi:hypothetical protein [Chlorogloeopsis fritschii]|uniref:hypothetical protein n=1 Tax=Chlorogloeopsis fritschii TaxID=1124 RepID=UPI0012FE1727|nr:hypothetical protein [Chlorogloeopsis fritschii]